MKPNIKLLEERVRRVVDRLAMLKEERDRLRDESEALQSRLDALEKDELQRQGAAEGTAGIGEISDTLHEVIRELRGE